MCFAGCSGARNQARTNDTVLFEFLMENGLSREIQPLATKHGSHLGEFAGDLLAARGSFFELLRKLQVRQSFAPPVQPAHSIRSAKVPLPLSPAHNPSPAL